MLSNVDAQDASKVEENAKVTLFLANKKCNVDSTRGRTDYVFERIVHSKKSKNDDFILFDIIN